MPLGEDGLGLSGGQKQIIALARMTLRNPKVVLLDEPTTSLDQATERMALNAIAQWGRNRTMLLVTHRPQVLQIVNRIIVMDNGKVVMDGPRDLVLQKLMQNEQAKAANVKQQQQAAAPLNQQHDKAKGCLKPTFQTALKCKIMYNCKQFGFHPIGRSDMINPIAALPH